MHPILAGRQRLALYLLTWCLLAVLLALVAIEPGRAGLRDALLLTFPPTIIYAFFCLAAWYPARALPLETARATSILPAHLAAAIVLSAIWLLLFRLWARVLGEAAMQAVANRAAVFVVTGILLYVIAVAFCYVLVAITYNRMPVDRKSTRLNSSHTVISYAVSCLKKKKQNTCITLHHRPVI